MFHTVPLVITKVDEDEAYGTDWFTAMALKYCGRTYGTVGRDQYFFYRRCYQMTALQAYQETKRVW